MEYIQITVLLFLLGEYSCERNSSYFIDLQSYDKNYEPLGSFYIQCFEYHVYVKSLVECSAMCFNPRSPLWQDDFLESSRDCALFAYNETMSSNDNNCMLCLPLFNIEDAKEIDVSRLSSDYIYIDPDAIKDFTTSTSCWDLKKRFSPIKLDSGLYKVRTKQNVEMEVYCDMDTDGGGWTLVYSYEYKNYNNYIHDSNYVSPSPSWPASAFSPSVSTTVPTSEEETGALNFTMWKDFGDEFLVKSNINNWVACTPNGGSLVDYVHGPVSCKITTYMVHDKCTNVVPHMLGLISRGPSLFARDFYYYFDVDPTTNWPVADPCGNRELNHLQGVTNPSGSIYLRESEKAPEPEVILVYNNSNPSVFLPSCWHIQKQLLPSVAVSGVYRIETSTSHTVLDVYCDMDTAGGGLTLVYSYRYFASSKTFYKDGFNHITPSPDWPLYRPADLPVSTTCPISEDATGAMDFSLWKEIGDEFLIKSNINNWISCILDGGSLVTQTEGGIFCKVEKVIVQGLCEQVKPYRIIRNDYGLSLYGRQFYYYFETNFHSNWPVADPCGTVSTNHLADVNNPSGWIYLKPTQSLDIETNHVYDAANPTEYLPSCLAIKQQMSEAESGVYRIQTSTSHTVLDVYCDMDTADGGWTLVWSFRYTFYHDFTNAINMLWPSPNWSTKEPEVPSTTKIPSSEATPGAIDFSLWAEIGDNFLVKSNITNWFKCVPNGGNLVTLTQGAVTCDIVKHLVDDMALCGAVVTPTQLLIRPAGPGLFATNHYFYFDTWHSNSWPVTDPCGRTETNHIHGVLDPAGFLYIK